MVEFEKDEIVACNDCEWLLHDIAKKINHNPSSIDAFLKRIIRKLEMIIIKKVLAGGKKTTSSTNFGDNNQEKKITSRVSKSLKFQNL